jgi:hypothetical protein
MKTYGEFFHGESKSKYDQNGFDDTSNLDIHSEIGSTRCQLALTSESETPNENCVSAIVPDGTVYFFSTTTGKTWKRTTAAAYSLVNTNTNTVHRGARYFNGYLYYWTATKLGRFDLASTWTDTWQTLSNGNGRGSTILNMSLFIADGNDVSAVDSAGTFTQSALDLETNWLITDMTGVGTDLLIGTVNSVNNGKCKVFLWDTYSPSWTTEDDIFEAGVNCFIDSDNITFAQCGASGNLYYWTGARMERFGKIRGIATTNTATSHNLSSTLNGKPLFANATKVYSIHREDKDLGFAIANEYTSTGTISSIIAAGSQFLVQYGTGVDKIGTNYAIATLDTPESVGKYSNIIVQYDSLPAGTSIGIGTKVDSAGSYTAQTPIIDTIKKLVYFDGGLGDVNWLQAQITLTPATTSTPIIKAINLV